MQTFTKPENLNGAELKSELETVGIFIDKVFDFGDETIGFETNDQAKAAKVVANHNGTIFAPEPTIEDKLASVGLDLVDLKTALGI